MTRIYIAGPMDGIADHNAPAFDRAAQTLRALGYDVVNPAARGTVDGWVWADYMRRDIQLVAWVDGVALLPNWHASKGACLEVHVAEELGLPVGSVDWWIQNCPNGGAIHE